MKPFIFGRKIRANYPDNHIKGHDRENWWECLSGFKSKKARRQDDKRNLMTEMNET